MGNIRYVLYNIAIVVLYLLVLGLIFAGGWYLLFLQCEIPVIYSIPYTVVFILAGGLFGAWLWVFIRLPFGLAQAFDPMRNKIASGEIQSADEFAREIGNFMVNFFSFYRFDVVAVQMLVKGNAPVFVPGDYKNCAPDGEAFIEQSRQTEAIIPVGKHRFNSTLCHGYLLPVWFGKEWLGYLCVFTDTRLHKINLKFLNEFESLYLDDQLMHVLNYANFKQMPK
jgi:hypothetical protein